MDKRTSPAAKRADKSSEGSKVPAVSRAAAILRLLGKSNVPLGVQAIARELNLVPSTCLYLLRTLMTESLVAFDPDTKRYSLEVGVLTLGRQWLMRDRFNDLARPVLEQIAEEFDVAVFGVQVLGLDHIVVVAVSQAGSNFQLRTQMGSRFPALISATGRCIAAFGGYPEAQLRAKFETLRWDVPLTFDAWMAQVHQTRVHGVALDEGNHKSGATFVAAPVWNAHGKLSHSLVATGISSVLDPKGLQRLQQAVLTSARSLSDQLSGGFGRDA